MSDQEYDWAIRKAIMGAAYYRAWAKGNASVEMTMFAVEGLEDSMAKMLREERNRCLKVLEDYASNAPTEHQFVCSLLYENIKAGE